VVEGKGVVEK